MTGHHELKALLQEERQHIVSGDFVSLAELIERKGMLVERLDSTRATADELKEIRALSDRNDKLLLASRMGLEAGAQRIKDIVRAAEHATYATDGSKTTLRAPISTVFRKL